MWFMSHSVPQCLLHLALALSASVRQWIPVHTISWTLSAAPAFILTLKGIYLGPNSLSLRRDAPSMMLLKPSTRPKTRLNIPDDITRALPTADTRGRILVVHAPTTYISKYVSTRKDYDTPYSVLHVPLALLAVLHVPTNCSRIPTLFLSATITPHEKNIRIMLKADAHQVCLVCAYCRYTCMNSLVLSDVR
ncbi:hypothetical protein V8C37DRAFT_371200 [Trichoderma ceciliae]